MDCTFIVEQLETKYLVILRRRMGLRRGVDTLRAAEYTCAYRFTNISHGLIYKPTTQAGLIDGLGVSISNQQALRYFVRFNFTNKIPQQ
jgi:hypothetical protein